MIKGTNRSIIVMRMQKSSNFESAFFVLKKNSQSSPTDIIKEANRLVASGTKLKKFKNPSISIFAFLGFLLGATFSSLFWLLVCLLF